MSVKLTEEDKQYLKCLAESESQAIDQFDKTVLALAGGAFGVSFAFLKDIIKPDVVVHKDYLVYAWTLWCITLTLNLTSFYFSHLAMRRAQRKYWAGERVEEKLGGWFGKLVMWLNPISGIAFVAGLICMSAFVTTNLHDAKPNQSTITPPASTNAPASASLPTSTNAPASASLPASTNAPAPGHAGSP